MGEQGKSFGGLCRRAALASLVAVLAACAQEAPTPPPAPAPVTQPVPPPVVKRRPPAQAKKKTTPPLREEAGPPEPAGPTQPQQEASIAPQPAPAVPSTNELVGLDEQRATQLLGPATVTDTKSPATVWHYKSSRCELDLAFYMEMRSGRKRTLSYDFKGDAQTPEQRRACLKAIIEENRRSERS